MLQGYLGERGHRVLVRWAMRYGRPGHRQRTGRTCSAGCTRVLVFNAVSAVFGATSGERDATPSSSGASGQRRLPELRVVNQYHDDLAYIAALAATRARDHWQREGGPAREAGDELSRCAAPHACMLGDPYHCQCHKTARLLAEALDLPQGSWRVAFQSRFGRAKWLSPSTEQVLKELGATHSEKVDLICPGFAADCLETLEEIAMEGAETFRAAGGQALRYITCLNAEPTGMKALVALAEQHLLGWPTQERPDPLVLGAQRERARHMGARA
jgi:ferrochelatase